MYSEIRTKCWSIKEVNKNLNDRKPIMDYSIKYLRKAVSDLADMLNRVSENNPGEMIEIIDRGGQSRRFTLPEVSGMLSDVKMTVELNLIDNIDRWAISEEDRKQT